MQDQVFSFGRTKKIPFPNQYVKQLFGEYSQWAFDEDQAPIYRGAWRSKIFKVDDKTPLDLEIGTGNGFHFGNRAIKNQDRMLLGIELKFKPLIQSVRRPLREGKTNARMIRYNAHKIFDLFSQEEINHVFIHFPDPWELGPQWKHRLITDEFLDKLYSIQRPGSFIEFKTDSSNYFKWSLTRFMRSKYVPQEITTDLHKSNLFPENFITAFEDIFIRKGLSINFARFVKE